MCRRLAAAVLSLKERVSARLQAAFLCRQLHSHLCSASPARSRTSHDGGGSRPALITQPKNSVAQVQVAAHPHRLRRSTARQQLPLCAHAQAPQLRALRHQVVHAPSRAWVHNSSRVMPAAPCLKVMLIAPRSVRHRSRRHKTLQAPCARRLLLALAKLQCAPRVPTAVTVSSPRPSSRLSHQRLRLSPTWCAGARSIATRRCPTVIAAPRPLWPLPPLPSHLKGQLSAHMLRSCAGRLPHAPLSLHCVAPHGTSR